jgi:3',5'-cyclic AMP phosphodiesterase CpdA
MPVKFVYLTDNHYYPDAPKDFGAHKMLTQSDRILEAIVPAINALSPDFVLHGGDLLCGGGSFDWDSRTYDRALADVRKTFDGFDTPFYCIPGNHDCDAQTGSFEAFDRAFDTSNALSVERISSKRWVARANVYSDGVGMDTPQGVWSDRHDALLREADREAVGANTAIILCLHTWIFSDISPDQGEPKGLVENADRLVATLSDCASVIASFHGHRHLNRIFAYRDFLNIDTSCLVGYPLGFREVILHDRGYFETRFHTLPLPDLRQASYDRSTPQENSRWSGQPHDRDTEILIPRLQHLWAR